jgi:K+-transporting ATPase ATPase A chain
LTEQVIAVGPAASQIAIKQLGTNGGGFFNANSAHPFENPTPLSNFLELLAILLIPAALCYTFGVMVRDTRQGWVLLAAMTVIFVGMLLTAVVAEERGAVFIKQGVDHTASALQSGGNIEGKEVRFGIANSALWATATTAASNGSVSSMHDSYTPIGGLVPMWMIQLGEVVYGGVGSGLYGMVVFAIVAVFVPGLMVGRTLEYLGKKIEAYEMKMSTLIILIVPALVLIGTAVAVLLPAGKSSMANPGIRGFSEVLYAFSSASNNNGSAFAGLNANTPLRAHHHRPDSARPEGRALPTAGGGRRPASQSVDLRRGRHPHPIPRDQARGHDPRGPWPGVREEITSCVRICGRPS